MALGDVRQVGTEFKIGFNNLVYMGYLPEDGVSYSDNVSTEEIVTDERGANLTHMYFNDGKVIDVTFKIKSTGSITPPKKGAIISITAPDAASATNWLVQDADVTFNRSISMLKLSLLREDSMQSVYDGDVAPPTPVFTTLSDGGDQKAVVTVEVVWTTLANRPDAVDIYWSDETTIPATPAVTYNNTVVSSTGTLTTIGLEISVGSADTYYFWAVARNGSFSTQAYGGGIAIA